MNQVVTIEIPVDAEAAKVLQDVERRRRIGRLVSRLALLYSGDDALAVVLENASRKAQQAGLTDAEIETELTAYNAERRS